MNAREFLKYYYNNKNDNNEITLIGKVTGLEYVFRRYIGFHTDKDYWVVLGKDYLFDTTELLELYDIPNHLNV